MMYHLGGDLGGAAPVRLAPAGRSIRMQSRDAYAADRSRMREYETVPRALPRLRQEAYTPSQ